uniref:Uncharacterized protein n=1 Tax=Micrurus surinamensis TaxID=129470 RepID=A0A2D4NXM7_MICSU
MRHMKVRPNVKQADWPREQEEGGALEHQQSPDLPLLFLKPPSRSTNVSQNLPSTFELCFLTTSLILANFWIIVYVHCIQPLIGYMQIICAPPLRRCAFLA